MENNDHKTETYKSLITISTEGFKAIQYLNGGAIIAILTYLGTLKCVSTEILALSERPLNTFIWGLTLSTLVYVPSYITQYCLHNENYKRNTWFGKHQNWLYASLILVILSLILFCTGATLAVDALSDMADGVCTQS